MFCTDMYPIYWLPHPFTYVRKEYSKIQKPDKISRILLLVMNSSRMIIFWRNFRIHQLRKPFLYHNFILNYFGLFHAITQNNLLSHWVCLLVHHPSLPQSAMEFLIWSGKNDIIVRALNYKWFNRQELEHKSQLVFGAIRAQLVISSSFSLNAAWQAWIRIKIWRNSGRFWWYCRFLRFLCAVLRFRNCAVFVSFQCLRFAVFNTGCSNISLAKLMNV